MTSDLFIGVDMGTSACRCVAVDPAGARVAMAGAPLPPPLRDGPRVEQHPRQWWKAFTAALERLLRHVPAGGVRAIAVDGTSGTLLVTDADGNPLAPALMYNDARGSAAAQRIAAHAPAHCGAQGATSALAKLLYLLDGGAIGAARHALHQADWLLAVLCGRVGVSDENNSLKLGYDPVTRCWPPWLERLGVDPALLPRVVAPGTRVASLTAPAAAALGLAEDVQVIAGTTDGVAAFIASGAARIGDAVTSLGSTLVIKVLSAEPVFAPAYGVYSHRLGDNWLAGGASNTGGTVLRRFFDDARLEALSRGVRPDRPTGLDYYPLPAPGERFPVNDPQLAPRLAPRPDDDVVFLQGIMEGIARVERDGYRCLERLGAPYPRTVRTVGGGARNAAWTAIRHGMLGAEMVEALSEEAAYGTALLCRDGYKTYTKQ